MNGVLTKNSNATVYPGAARVLCGLVMEEAELLHALDKLFTAAVIKQLLNHDDVVCD